MSQPNEPKDDEARAATPPSLRERILAAANAQTFAFVMQHEGPWLPEADAPVAVKLLLADSRDRLSTRLVRFLEEGALPAPALPGRRAFFVVRGSVVRDAREGKAKAGAAKAGDAKAFDARAREAGARDAGAETLGAGAFRDEYPPQAWRAARGTLLIEYCEHEAGAERGQTHASKNAPWFDALPGGRLRPLEGGNDGPRSFLVLSMSPRSTLPSHLHHGVEELYVLSGSCTLDGRTLGAGDYHRAATQSTHPDTHTLDDGCEVLVALRDPERLALGEGAA